MTKSGILLVLFVIACFFAACKSTPVYDKETQRQIDIDSIQRFITKNGIIAERTPEGLFYTIVRPGTGTDEIGLEDEVVIHYVGRRLDGVVYDSTATNVDTLGTAFVLNNSIEGWQKGIPLIKTGGTIRLIVPSAMAFQNRVVDTSIGPNSNLDFDIRLIKVTKKDKIK
jgi:FKBP-type peptidyl-prolyl cis-trans isomerase FkpA